MLNAPVDGLERLSGGASRETWAFTADGRELILRRDPPGRAADFGSMALEAAAIRAASAAGLAVPEVLVVDDGGRLGTAGMVMARVEGETVARRILREAGFAGTRAALTGQLARFMAGLHGIDVASVPGLPEPDALEFVEGMYAEVDDVSPTFDAGLRWLHRHRPSGGGRAIVHGDLRLGNVIVGPEGLRAVIDWELVHVGDPVEDLAWVCVRAWRFGAEPEVAGVGTVDELLSAYGAAGGVPVERRTFEWWLVEKTLQWGVICMKQAAAHLTGADRSVELAAIGRRVAEVEWDLLELLAPELAPPAPPSPTKPPIPGAGAVMATAAETAETAVPGLYGRPTAEELLEAAQEFLLGPVSEATGGQVRFHARVTANVLATVARQLREGPAAQERARQGLARLGAASFPELSARIRTGELDGREGELFPFLWSSVSDRLAVANPRHLAQKG
ncbi:MAG TPA: phosphotransferase family protein [Acidimicrobiia bacterium]|nr:phosphotransferase family protein [Acidimicrobiia bacterium]